MYGHQQCLGHKCAAVPAVHLVMKLYLSNETNKRIYCTYSIYTYVQYVCYCMYLFDTEASQMVSGLCTVCKVTVHHWYI